MDNLRALLEWPAVRGIAVILATMIVVTIVVRIAKRALQARIAETDLRYRSGKIVSLAGYVVVIITIATQVAGQLSGLTVALGAASAGIAFALQEVIASFAGWLAVALGGFFNVGDRVQLGGIRGDVIDIGFLRTTIMETGDWVKGDLYNGRIVRVANSFVFKEPVFNYSGEFPFLWDEIVVPVKYGSDYEEARRILKATADDVCEEHTAAARASWPTLVRRYRIEDARVEPIVTLIANDNWVEFTVRYVVALRARRSTKDALFTRILAAFEGTDNRVGWASMTVQLVEAPTLRVAVEGSRGAGSRPKGVVDSA